MEEEDLLWVKLANEGIKRSLENGPGVRVNS